jgi:hypothetical protein
MNASDTTRNAWKELTEEVTTCVIQAIKAHYTSARIVHHHILRAQAEVLKGLLAAVEAQLNTTEPGSPPPSEKIPVE